VIRQLIDLSVRQARRLVIAVIGTTVLLLGIALIVLPGPAFIVIPVGLAILAVEFAWARRLLHRVRRGISETLRNGRLKGLSQQ
jgi:tellurite resistance protein TerC